MHYNFARPHNSLKERYPRTPAMATGVTDLNAAATEDEVFGHRVRFRGYEHPVEMKEAAGRVQNLMDLKNLREAREDG